MVFCRGTKQNLLNLMNLFREYEETSGQVLSLSKCRFYPGCISSSRIATLSNVLGFTAGSIPFKYLGVPIFRGKLTKSHLQPIAYRVKSKLSTWKGSLLSIIGRVQLVKSIIQGMLLYNFHTYLWPASLLKSMEPWIKNFVWSGDIFKRKLVTVAWKTVCTPFLDGGLGIRPLKAINHAALLKLSWNVISLNN